MEKGIFCLLIFYLIINGGGAFAEEGSLEEEGLFSGRISQISPVASLIRIKVDFANAKFLNVKDTLSFWTPQNKTKSCQCYIIGKTHSYLLMKVVGYDQCEKGLRFTQGSLLYFFSKDLKESIAMAHDLLEILVKKRMAVESKLNHEKKELDSYIEKIEAVNNRYQILKRELDVEWQTELENLQVDKLKTLRNYKSLEVRLGEIGHKLEQYRIQDQNLEKDRWSLDARLYYKK